jgi:hypothetical protein
MDNLERRESSQELSPWVKACSDLLAPPADWEPNLNTALARFEDRADARLRWRSRMKRYLLVGAMATLLACVAVPAIPPTRAFAQQIGNGGWRRVEQLWYWITIVRGPWAQLNMLPDAEKALHSQRVVKPGGPQAVSNAAEAALRAGFIPRLPNSSVLSGSPRLSVLGPMSFVAVISGADLAEALRTARVLDRQVPQQWDGAQLTLQIGATVIASWSDERSGVTAWSELTLAQGPIPEVTAPAGFNLESFAMADLQAAGMWNRDMAQRLAQHPSTVPALLFGCVTAYHYVRVLEVNLRTGSATLIQEFGLASQEHGFGYSDGVPRVERLTLLWSMRDRVYVLSGRTEPPPGILSADLAAAVASAIDLANTID